MSFEVKTSRRRINKTQIKVAEMLLNFKFSHFKLYSLNLEKNIQFGHDDDDDDNDLN